MNDEQINAIKKDAFREFQEQQVKAQARQKAAQVPNQGQGTGAIQNQAFLSGGAPIHTEESDAIEYLQRRLATLDMERETLSAIYTFLMMPQDLINARYRRAVVRLLLAS